MIFWFIIWAILIIFAFIGADKITVGLEFASIVPTTAKMYDFIKWSDDYFSTYDCYLGNHYRIHFYFQVFYIFLTGCYKQCVTIVKNVSKIVFQSSDGVLVLSRNIKSHHREEKIQNATK